MAIDQPLSATEIVELADFLDSELLPADAMNISMLDGYLTALAIGPETVLPSAWLPLVWGSEGDPGFDSLEQAQHVLDLIMRFYNQVILTFMEAPEEFEPYLEEYEEDGKVTLSAEEWCMGFSMGVHLRSEAWEQLLEDKEAAQLLGPIVAFSLEEAWNEMAEGAPNPDELREVLIELLPDCVQGIHEYWLPHREKRTPGMTADSFRMGGKSKTPRNAPCPCGSGKKYKKCCGTAVKM